ncbi:MAG TPA: hypothetical protein VGL99_17055 [Chloroflexota bacterium]
MIGLTTSALSTIARIGREPGLQTAAVLGAAPATAAGLHALGVSTDLDSFALAQGLVDLNLWFALGMAALFGGIGGLIAELLSLHGNIELPHRVRQSHHKHTRLADARDMVDLGVISRMLVGAAAALAMLSVYAPLTATALLVDALIAGSAGTAVFRLVQSRFLANADNAKQPRKLRAVPTSETKAA